MSFGEHDENLKHSHVHVIACYHTVSNRDQYLDFVSLVSGQLKVCPLLSTFWGRFPACKHLFTFNAFANEFCIYIPFIWNLFLLTCYEFYCSIVLTTTVEPNTESNKKNENEKAKQKPKKDKKEIKEKSQSELWGKEKQPLIRLLNKPKFMGTLHKRLIIHVCDCKTSFSWKLKSAKIYEDYRRSENRFKSMEQYQKWSLFFGHFEISFSFCMWSHRLSN